MLFYVRHMSKPKQPKPPDIPSAIRELRAISRESQQFFGARLRISTRALQLYESGDRIPEARQLVAFAAFADFVRRPELTELFIRELERQLAPPPGYEATVVFSSRSGVGSGVFNADMRKYLFAPPLEDVHPMHGSEEEMKRRVIAITRVSTQGQVGEDKYGQERQRHDIAQAAAMHDLEIIRSIEVVESGSTAFRREDFQQVFADLARPDIAGAVVAAVDRLVLPGFLGDR